MAPTVHRRARIVVEHGCFIVVANCLRGMRATTFVRSSRVHLGPDVLVFVNSVKLLEMCIKGAQSRSDQLGLRSPGLALHVRAIVQRSCCCPSVHMRPSLSSSPAALLASTARAAHGLARWLVLLLLVFDQFSAPWHAHQHQTGVDGTAVAVVRAQALQSEARTEAHAAAPDHRPTGAHATAALRSEVGPSLATAGDNDDGHVRSWPVARLAQAIKGSTRLAITSQHQPPTAAQCSLRPAPRAPPWRA